MNKNTTIGLLLMALLLIGYTWYVQPSEEQIAMQRQEDSIANAIKQKAEQAQKAEEAARKAQAAASAKGDTSALFHPALNGINKQVTLKNDKVELTLETKGGVIKKAKILGFKDHTGAPDVTLFDGKDQSLNFMMAGKETNIITADLYFTPSNVTDSTVTMTAQAGNGGALILDYVLGKDYLLGGGEIGEVATLVLTIIEIVIACLSALFAILKAVFTYIVQKPVDSDLGVPDPDDWNIGEYKDKYGAGGSSSAMPLLIGGAAVLLLLTAGDGGKKKKRKK